MELFITFQEKAAKPSLLNFLTLSKSVSKMNLKRMIFLTSWMIQVKKKTERFNTLFVIHDMYCMYFFKYIVDEVISNGHTDTKPAFLTRNKKREIENIKTEGRLLVLQ